ncbi:hypothetical protein [Pararhodobacter aggregans]|uniref:Uncharacterized protein n=1 Tax=Pararhodobacter aggregans TaxID=404875 RepID=A0A2T7UVA4_9RHOB|nr:hypothetical protein [Pararhodobacter aggregans]PTX04021.1 hypothetical protein C8N33_102296 [Pararhodobacter aggregans]PVE48508.1 hypothetical protein DDE23_05490 [Pararhodobacter aggregans]
MMIPAAPLRSTMATLAVACIAGALVIAGLAFGWYDWRLFALAGVAGLVIGVPLGIAIARRMRAQPPLPRPEGAAYDPEAAQRAVDPSRPVAYPPALDQQPASA